jgi:hypothetical protein
LFAQYSAQGHGKALLWRSKEPSCQIDLDQSKPATVIESDGHMNGGKRTDGGTSTLRKERLSFSFQSDPGVPPAKLLFS